MILFVKYVRPLVVRLMPSFLYISLLALTECLARLDCSISTIRGAGRVEVAIIPLENFVRFYFILVGSSVSASYLGGFSQIKTSIPRSVVINWAVSKMDLAWRLVFS